MEENKTKVNMKFNLKATKPKINVFKTKARRNICNNKITNLIYLKGNSSNIQTSKSGCAINKVFFVSFSIFHCYKMRVCNHYYILRIIF